MPSEPFKSHSQCKFAKNKVLCPGKTTTNSKKEHQTNICQMLRFTIHSHPLSILNRIFIVQIKENLAPDSESACDKDQVTKKTKTRKKEKVGWSGLKKSTQTHMFLTTN